MQTSELRLKQLLLLKENDMLDENSKIELEKMNKDILFKKYNVSEYSTGYYCTIEKKRIHKRTCKAMYDYLCAQEKLKPTLKQVFLEAKNKATQRASSSVKLSTITEYDKAFNIYLKPYENMNVQDFNDIKILNILQDIVLNKGSLSKSQYNKIIDVFKLIFRYAYRLDVKYVNFDIDVVLKRIDKRDFVRSSKTKNVDDLVFTELELHNISEYCKEHIDDKNLLIALMIGTGIRPGEAVALHSDSIFNNIISITRCELSYVIFDENNKQKVIYEIQDGTKTECGYRNVAVFRNQWALVKLSENKKGYLTPGINTKALTDRLYRICKKLQIKPKSTNKIRKSVATLLSEIGLSESDIINQLGHADIKVTKKNYIKNRIPCEERLSRILKLSSGTNGTTAKIAEYL